MFPHQVWSIATTEPVLYLTFDDGPTAGITDWVLDELKKHNAQATFFLVGQNAEQNPLLVKRMLREGHSVGNHTQRHLNGWLTENKTYLKDVLRCHSVIPGNLFRPPYGRITKTQVRNLKSKFRIIMWDVLSGDFDMDISREKCLNNVIRNAGRGSIVVFHDSKKAMSRLQYALPRVLRFFARKGFRFHAL